MDRHIEMEFAEARNKYNEIEEYYAKVCDRFELSI